MSWKSPKCKVIDKARVILRDWLDSVSEDEKWIIHYGAAMRAVDGKLRDPKALFQWPELDDLMKEMKYHKDGHSYYERLWAVPSRKGQPQLAILIPEAPGFELRVSANRKTISVRYHDHQSVLKRHTIGQWPDITLTDAVSVIPKHRDRLPRMFPSRPPIEYYEAHKEPRPRRSFSAAQRMEIRDRHGDLCYWCGIEDHDLVMDHYIPFVRGGPTEVWNGVPSCQSCNSQKRDKMPDHFRAELEARSSAA